ncbi:preprotein translocase subunit SecE [bacterium]|nr:preprotein translocase subunit SecE [bacterium]
MLDFIYDSLDTVKSLKHPDKKMYLSLTAAIFAVVIVTGVYFLGVDWVVNNAYQIFYHAMSGTL